MYPALRGLAKHLKTAVEEVANKDTRKGLAELAKQYIQELDVGIATPDRMVDLEQYGGFPKDKLAALNARNRQVPKGCPLEARDFASL